MQQRNNILPLRGKMGLSGPIFFAILERKKWI
jgi:hypothetical protein